VKKSFFIPFCIALILAFTACKKNTATQPPVIDPPPVENWPTDSIRTVKTGLSFPWEILWGKDGFIWMTERGGRISKIDPKTGNTAFSAVVSEVVSQGEGGLLGMVQHPDFLNNGFLYVVYNYTKNGTYTEKVVRFTFVRESLTDPLIILDNIPAASIHNGSRLWITTDNKLLITTGDAANTSLPQNANSLAGKLLRINLDGTIPADNPTAGNPMWSMGHRNAQGLVVVNGKIYTSEHGPSIEDEVNVIEKGRNYGWPNVNGPCDGSELTFCNTNNIAIPIWSSGSSTVATAGMDYYNLDRIPKWKNSILMTTLKDATLYQLKLNAAGTSVESVSQFFRGNWGRLRDVCISPEGRLYICTSNGGGNDRIIEVQR
jgi:glucose/arabinose dehydrogenase